jgi:hypothetical protein
MLQTWEMTLNVTMELIKAKIQTKRLKVLIHLRRLLHKN